MPSAEILDQRQPFDHASEGLPPTSDSYNPGGRGHCEGSFWDVMYRMASKYDAFMVFLLPSSALFAIHQRPQLEGGARQSPCKEMSTCAKNACERRKCQGLLQVQNRFSERTGRATALTSFLPRTVHSRPSCGTIARALPLLLGSTEVEVSALRDILA